MTRDRNTGQLIVGGDWAIAHGNVGGLAMIAKQLAKTVSGPLHRELMDIATLCAHQADLAATRWFAVRKQLAA